jgi:hypothetical protein
MIEAFKRFISEKWIDAAIILAAGFLIAVSYPKYVITTDTFAQEKQTILQKLDTNVAALKIANIDLEVSVLRKEQNDLLDLVDANKAKQRHKSRLIEIQYRLIELDKQKQVCEKVLENK